jgi:hypothetical protein
MALYETCSSCVGNRSFRCDKCRCPSCDAKGRVKEVCKSCSGTTHITCRRCEGTGQVLVKKGFFSDKYGTCPSCEGDRRVRCKTCSDGKVEVKCSVCNGTGAQSSCSTCQGKGQLSCSSCGGTGRVRPSWSRDRIRQEIEERRSQIREEERTLEYWYEEYNNKPYLYEDGFPGRGSENALSRLRDEISELMDML